MNTTLSNYAKIIDPNSEYYGQVFEVRTISIDDKEISVETTNASYDYFKFHQIQFCVTKDKTDGTSEPVKIGEEYVCWDNIENEEDLFESYHGKLWSKAIQKAITAPFPEVALQYVVQKAYEKGKKESEDLHPTNKIKITAEKIDGVIEDLVDKFEKDLKEVFNRLSK